MKLFKIFAITLACAAGTACSSNAQKSNASANADGTDSIGTHKVLVAYFSATGTTRDVAEKIAGATGATLYEITPEPRYTDADLDWHDKQSRSSVEMNDASCRPALGGDSIDVADYNVVFIGYPIWWDLAPRQVNTFIESNDLAGKTLIPFATSGGSTIDNSVADLRRLYPDLMWGDGKLLNGGDVAEWAKKSL